MAMRKFPLMGILLLLTIVGSPTTVDGSVETSKGPVCPPKPSGEFGRSWFPENFIFGTATAAYQVEGAVEKGGRGKSMWDVYCEKHADRCNNENGNIAVDFYHKYKSDIGLMKELNTDAFRLSIAWPRIFPNGKNDTGPNPAGVQFYHDVLDELNDKGITPFVTIFHWDIPQDLEKYGGFLNETIVKDFGDYAKFLFKQYGGKVQNWVTINEPWVYAHAGYDVGKKAPGRCTDSEHSWKGHKGNLKCLGGESGKEAYIVTHNLLLAHLEAVEAFRECQKTTCKGGKIGIAHSPAWFEPHELENEKDIQRALDFMLGWHADPTTSGDYPQSVKDRIGKILPKLTFTDDQKKRLAKSTDFFGLNYYTSVYSKNLKTVDEEKRRWLQDSGIQWKKTNRAGYNLGSNPKTSAGLAVYSNGLRKLLQYIKKTYGNQEIIILENGYGDKPAAEAKNVTLQLGTADDNRKYYLKRHLFTLYQAICDDKVNVTGYFAWSLLDNFEWQDGYKVRFGLYHVDFQNGTLRRDIKVSGEFYRDFLNRRTTKNDEL